MIGVRQINSTEIWARLDSSLLRAPQPALIFVFTFMLNSPLLFWPMCLLHDSCMRNSRSAYDSPAFTCVLTFMGCPPACGWIMLNTSRFYTITGHNTRRACERRKTGAPLLLRGSRWKRGRTRWKCARTGWKCSCLHVCFDPHSLRSSVGGGDGWSRVPTGSLPLCGKVKQG